MRTCGSCVHAVVEPIHCSFLYDSQSRQSPLLPWTALNRAKRAAPPSVFYRQLLPKAKAIQELADQLLVQQATMQILLVASRKEDRSFFTTEQACMCVCVCVCVRARERVRVSGRDVGPI